MFPVESEISASVSMGILPMYVRIILISLSYVTDIYWNDKKKMYHNNDDVDAK